MRSHTAHKEEGVVRAESVEATEPVVQYDRFEVGGRQHNTQDEGMEPDAEEGQLLEEALDDPLFAKAVSWPVLLAQESFSPNLSSSFTGIMALVDTHDDELG